MSGKYAIAIKFFEIISVNRKRRKVSLIKVPLVNCAERKQRVVLRSECGNKNYAS